jgi:hypothetical protein
LDGQLPPTPSAVRVAGVHARGKPHEGGIALLTDIRNPTLS